MLNELKWFHIASMDKRVLRDVRMLCEVYGLRWWIEDDPNKPYTAHIKTDQRTYMTILRRCGFQVGRVI